MVFTVICMHNKIDAKHSQLSELSTESVVEIVRFVLHAAIVTSQFFVVKNIILNIRHLRYW